MKLTPEEKYGALYTAVQKGEIFDDGKLFSDASAKISPEKIIANYQELKDNADFNLKDFVLDHFQMPKSASSGFESNVQDSLTTHIEKLWPVLSRNPDQQKPEAWSSLIPLPYPYIVPGGRFNEIYYWDSYFTMLGLKVSGHSEIILNMIKNFAWMMPG